MSFRHHVALAVALAAALGSGAATRSQDAAGIQDARVDAIFARWTASTPGCAAGVSVGGRVVLQKAYGLADLEHDVKNAPETIFEAGSVSKQFTAASVLLLAQDGRLSLDDPVRKYVPELPDYGRSLTIRHMLTHTSGLRDWGEVAAIAGWPRTSRVHTHDHVLDILSKQRQLNFPTGTNWSYSNSGYNLSAVIVSRVAGEPFAEFSRRRIFEPLGMTRTSWRDDFTRVVKGRAIAYDEARGAFRQNMPFENVHGNGGLLTTAGDLLRWTGNSAQPKVGGADFVRQMETPGRFDDGTAHDYGLGLYIGRYKTVKQIGHAGSTAGYRAYLARYPDQGVSVAVLCNVSTGQAEQYAHGIADLYLAGSIRPAEAPRAVVLSSAELDARVGTYRDLTNGEPTRISRDGETLRLQGGATLTPLSPGRFAGGSAMLEFDGTDRLRVTAPNGTYRMLERAESTRPSAEELRAYEGTYVSDEAEVTLTVRATGGTLEVQRRPSTAVRLAPAYADTFTGTGLGTLRFHRDRSGRIVELSVVTGRVWDMRFRRAADVPH